MESHKFYLPRGGGKQVCSHCGLVNLNNRLTDWSIKKGCNFDEHPDNKRMLKQRS